MNKKQALGAIILTATIIAAVLCFHPSFNAGELVKNSELGGHTFSHPIQEIISPRYGIRAYLLEDSSNPIISLGFLFTAAGRRAEEKGQAGLAGLTAAILPEAAGNLKSAEFKEKMESYAISIGYSSDKDDFSGHLLTVKEYAPIAFDMLKDTLIAPRVDRTDLKRLKKQMLALLDSQVENPSQQLSLTANRELFGTHPYGANPLGIKEDIERLSSKDIKKYAASHLGRSNLIVGIAGDMTAAEAAEMLDNVFGALPAEGAADDTAIVKPDLSGGFSYHNAELPQSMAYVAAEGTRRNATDFYPLYIANYILGGSGLNSRLNLAAREKEGLTYGIYTGISVPDKTALIIGGFSATPENFSRVVEIFSHEWKLMGEKGVSSRELEEAKNYLIASNNLRFADITNISNMLVYMQKENLGIDFLQKRNQYVAQVTLEQVNRASARYFRPENLKIISLGKFN